MSRTATATVVNLDDRMVKRQLLTHLGALTGPWWVELKPWRPRRSNLQNAYWHAVIVKGFFEFLRTQDYSISKPEQAHYLLCAKLLPTETVVNKSTGEVMGDLVRTSSQLTTAEFTDLIDRALIYLADMFGIVLPLPDPDWRNALLQEEQS